MVDRGERETSKARTTTIAFLDFTRLLQKNISVRIDGRRPNPPSTPSVASVPLMQLMVDQGLGEPFCFVLGACQIGKIFSLPTTLGPAQPEQIHVPVFYGSIMVKSDVHTGGRTK